MSPALSETIIHVVSHMALACACEWIKAHHCQTACASATDRLDQFLEIDRKNVDFWRHQVLEIVRKSWIFRGRFWTPPGLIKCPGGTILASTMWTLFWAQWAAGDPILGRTWPPKSIDSRKLYDHPFYAVQGIQVTT